MQSTCAYESAYIGSSDFCDLFTGDEWAGFEQTLDIEYYYDYAWVCCDVNVHALSTDQSRAIQLDARRVLATNRR